ncbi:MAG: VOC family protein [Mycobacterium sp.]|nr:VOC family protein [Mycobacterium sp.]
MSTRVQITVDCADPATLSQFWADALGYTHPEPPDDYPTWEAFLAANGVPESEWNSASAVEDPEGVGPRLFFQRVPEPKAGKNRVHLDLNVSGGREVALSQRIPRVRGKVSGLVRSGGRVVAEHEKMSEFWIVMTDPEGNEFCVQ